MTVSTDGPVAEQPAAQVADPLFRPLRVGAMELQHRIVLAPLTRRRNKNNVPQPLMTEYYAQRATPGGLLITEATGISPEGLGDPYAPGIWSDEQTEAWRKLVADVKRRVPGVQIVVQLWHLGRLVLPEFTPNHTAPLAPSAIAVVGSKGTNAKGEEVPYALPRAMTKEDIRNVIAEYRRAAENAKRAGFDSVEIHGANGYLIDQFLRSSGNQRTDEYGGTPEKRTRFMQEVLAAVVDVWGRDRVGIRFSPYAPLFDLVDDSPLETFGHAVRHAHELGAAYVHLVEARPDTQNEMQQVPSLDGIAAQFPGTVIRASGFEPSTARTAVASRQADLIAFGRHFIANPDLPERIRRNLPLNKYDRSTFFTQGATGYIDYPRSDEPGQRKPST
ncbi:NADH:flavin oxidoreductase/NADH oxidase [Thamnocephalis sphaerospora]|uniref:NADH:flavin oxidoreductase/NADH oxidase n=1 Tax=Thamnocephalis sphaerospora TaxID=78915 RepID=A0A4P9XV86_9FUNG|nr:NADH:flavin oxidoreductase/NADH oxidase [Thamnocephalis sphaerospora]|eukprot:RKP10175.1 NADH:flavin oxidoreductase/NADH oxidase [Thamnocephalis sphaerospora]